MLEAILRHKELTAGFMICAATIIGALVGKPETVERDVSVIENVSPQIISDANNESSRSSQSYSNATVVIQDNRVSANNRGIAIGGGSNINLQVNNK